MSTEENKALVRRFLEGIFSQGNPDVVDELADPDFVVHDPSSEAKRWIPKASKHR